MGKKHKHVRFVIKKKDTNLLLHLTDVQYHKTPSGSSWQIKAYKNIHAVRLDCKPSVLKCTSEWGSMLFNNLYLDARLGQV